MDKLNPEPMLKAISAAMDAVMYARQAYEPDRQPTTYAILCDVLKTLDLAFEQVEATEDAAYDEPGPLPDPDYLRDARQDVLDDYYEECKADCDRTGRF